MPGFVKVTQSQVLLCEWAARQAAAHVALLDYTRSHPERAELASEYRNDAASIWLQIREAGCWSHDVDSLERETHIAIGKQAEIVLHSRRYSDAWTEAMHELAHLKRVQEAYRALRSKLYDLQAEMWMAETVRRSQLRPAAAQ